jgi:hypothetical protein
MFKKVTTTLAFLKAGRRVNNPESWKKGQLSADAVRVFLSAATACWFAFTGQEVVIDGLVLDSLSAALVAAVPAIIGVYTGVATVISTNKIGL